jgi:hypothetical protein
MSKANATIKNLRALLRDHSIPLRQIPKHVKEITGNNDRLVAVVLASVLEKNLTSLLEDVLLKTDHERLFGPRCPLATFSAKIDLCHALNLIDSDIRRNCDYIREIRNTFAHKIGPISFRTKEVAAVCKLLELGAWEGRPKAKTNMRARYLFAATNTASSIAKFRLESDFKKMPPASLKKR